MRSSLTKRHQALPPIVLNNPHTHEVLVKITSDRVVGTTVRDVINGNCLETIVCRRGMRRYFPGGEGRRCNLYSMNKLTPAQFPVLEVPKQFCYELVHS